MSERSPWDKLPELERAAEEFGPAARWPYVEESLNEVRVVYTDLDGTMTVSYTHLRAHETVLDLVCRLLLEKKKTITTKKVQAKAMIPGHQQQRPESIN